jgi:putative ABC transport system permease protein
MQNDFKGALNALLKAPGFTVAATLTLALGIGANTAIFSVINEVLLRELPYREPDRLVMLWEHNLRRDKPMNVLSPANFQDWRERSQSFEAMGGFFDRSFTLTGSGDPESIRATAVTPNVFAILGGQAHLGRVLAADDERPESPLSVVLSHKFWQERFGGDPGIIGRTLTLSGTAANIVGVMPSDFGFYVKEASFNGAPPQVWVQARFDAESRQRRGRFMAGLGRLKDGVGLEQARAEMKTIASSLEQGHPDFNKDWSVNLVPLREQFAGEIRPVLLVVFGAVCLTLFIACANVANLQLVRASARAREFTVRAALGASRHHLVRGLLAESVLLGVLGGALGLGLGQVAMAGLYGLMPKDLLPGDPLGLDPRVLGFTLVVSVCAGLLFGLLPALAASKPHLAEALRDGSRGATSARSRHLRQGFVTAQVALGLVVLIGAGLLVRSFDRLISADIGFDGRQLLTARITLPAGTYAEPAKVRAFFDRLLPRVRAIPGVSAVSGNVFAPFSGPGAATSFGVVGREIAKGDLPVTDVRIVAPDYFSTLGIPLLQGRDFLREEHAQARHVVIINESLARRHFPGKNPIGEKLEIYMADPLIPSVVVGVVGDIRHRSLDSASREMVYWPHAELPIPSLTLLIRSTQSPLQITPSLQREVWALDRSLPVSEPRTMEQLMSGTVQRARFATLLFGLFAALALALSALGIYGVVSYKVMLETRDIGVRMALGADRLRVLRIILMEGGRLAALGVAVGLAGAFALTRLLASQLYEVSSTDPATFIAAPAILLLLTTLASIPAALRAAFIDPIVALRDE